MTDNDPLVTRLDAGVLTLTLDRSGKRNALSSALVHGLHQALERAEFDGDVSVVVIRGAGPDFCAGADLAELLASADNEPAANERDALALGSLFTRIRRLPRIVVAAVQGRALAGGAGLATACDIVLACRSARFGYPEIQRGFVPAMVMTLLRRLVGEKAAFELVSTGRLIDADEAAQRGLVSRVIGDEAFDAEVDVVLRGLAAAPASALALTKQLFYELDGRSFEEGIALGARINALARETPEFRLALSRFLER